jgi:Fic family protein
MWPVWLAGRPCAPSSPLRYPRRRRSIWAAVAKRTWSGPPWHWVASTASACCCPIRIKQHRQVYYDLLDRVRTDGDWEAWIDFFLEGVEQTANSAVQTARRLVDLFQQDARRVQAGGRGAANTLRVLDALRQRPLCNLAHASSSAGISFPTASRAMLTLVELGIARELTGQRRNRVFVYDAYLGILNEGGEAL